ncbi:MAG: HAMP domain-containing sensor histidine kinase [Oscillospiraceae bacterium]|nr:HAMP domain-containing sensor histidine kinase [Oscillospiraceae bacterium]
MKKSRKNDIFFLTALFIALTLFSVYYFHSVSDIIQTYAQRDTNLLQQYNDDIVNRLQTADSVNEWQDIINSYDGIVTEIKDENDRIVAHTKERNRSLLDTKVQKAFVYKDNAYIIKTSIYFMRDYLTDSGYLFKLLLIVFGMVTLFLLLLSMIIYALMLRPMHKFYVSIEKYEKGEPVKRMNSRSEVGRLQNRFVDMTETISKQQQNQRRIIASISHDIKTPLTSIMGYAEMMKKENLSEERKQRYLNTVYEKAVAIRDMVDDFDEYLSYNMDSSLRKTKMTVSDMLEKLTEGYEDELQSFGVDLICNLEQNDDIVDVDIQKMRRVIGNIIGNSLKHFNSERKLIEIECKKKPGIAQIIVSDNGEGVEEEKLEVIFEPLYTSDEGRKVAGLGLAICREIVESHGGEIYAEKSKFGGLAVVIELKTIPIK